MYHDYGARLTDVPPEVEGYVINGSAGSVASGRVAYTFGLEGPAVTIDTACSSSLVALHLAAGALRNGECTLALAGGVTVMSTPAPFVEFSRQGGLAPDGRCKAFSAAADGTGWGEGVGLLVLERLSDARRHGHPVLAILRGSAVNQDGASNGLTAPNGPSQQRVIRQALENAGLRPDEVDAVEAHGTGTRLGDPIEAQALLAAYGQDREQPLWLGSVKSNIGHTQAAAGVAGVIKMVMAMRHGTLPRTLHADEPTPHVDWSAGAVSLLTEQQPWPDHDRPRRAGVSSFGVSGTNAHVILEQPQVVEARAESADIVPPSVPWVISARDEKALRAAAGRLAERARDEDAVLDTAHSLVTSRALLTERAVIVCEDPDTRRQALETFAAGHDSPHVITGRASDEATLTMVFSGQGNQRPGMGRELYDTYPAYADAFDTACTALDPHLDHPLHDIIHGTHTHLLNQTQYTQPAIFALQTALYRLYEHWGITPHTVTGHSIGEITAAHITGILTLQEAATLITHRAHLMQQLPPGGAMVAINITEQEIQPHLTGHEHTTAIAAINSPTSLVLSGLHTTLTTITNNLPHHRTTWLNVSHAFHSPLMQPTLHQLHHTTQQLNPQPPTIPLISTLTGQPINHTDPHHWTHHALHTVRLTDALHHINTHNPTTTYLEIGPDATLTPPPPPNAIPTLRKNQPETHTLTTAIAHLTTHGTTPNWHTYYHHPHHTPHHTPLPTYPFQHQRYWLDNTPPRTADLDAAGLDSAGHPILRASVTLPSSDRTLFTGRVALDVLPWLADHAVHGAVVFPGTGFLDMVVHAGRRSGHPRLAELTMDVPLVIEETGGVQVRVEVGEPVNGRREVAVYARPEDAETGEPWTRHCAGVLETESGARPEEPVHWPPADAVAQDISGFYERMEEIGIGYGPAFRGLRALWRRDDELYAEIQLDGLAGDFPIHPALFDAALHAGAVDSDGERADLPFSWSGVTLRGRSGDRLTARLIRRGSGEVALDLADPSGGVVASVASLVGRPVAEVAGRTGRTPLLRVEWQPVVLPSVSGVPSDADVVRIDGRQSAPMEVAEAARVTAETALGSVQDWLARQPDARSRLVVVTDGLAGEDPARRLPAAAVWGLVRSAQVEYPGRIVLIDGDGPLAAAVASGEPQIMLRPEGAFVPRLVRGTPTGADSPWRPGTVLLTGASGALGSRVARHLVETHGVQRLVLITRHGESAPGARDLVARLRALGAEVECTACDVADRRALAEVLAAIPEQWPLSSVVHCAGVVDDATFARQSGERLRAVFEAKVMGAWHLHELTRGMDLSAFVLFSSAAGVLGSAGQANYAAANGFLDALAETRRAEGLAGVSLAWGLWDVEDGMAGKLGAHDVSRLDRSGLVAIREEQALAMFDAALSSKEAVVVPLLLDRGTLRAASVEPPAVLRAFVDRSESRAARSAGESLRDRIGGLSGEARRRVLVDVVCSEVAATLGHASADAIGARRSFTDLGFDSLTAVELRNRLTVLTGVELPATVAFDHPSPQSLATFLDGELPHAADTLPAELDRLEALLTVAGEETDRAHIAERLEHLLSEWKRRGDETADRSADLDEATTPEELMDFIDRNL
ncbi:SDR family NAD(P)-dependent oxidoreductase [Streptomyces seoulensis]|nr:SDR family NAD(P)-dependent oxidoreductase [Streptomyces seoulensis]